jgi:peptide/nickel transport system substrate-binding protein
MRRELFKVGLAVLAACWWSGAVMAQNTVPPNKVFRFVPHANLAVLDPIWTTAYVTRNHGYMIYDTLFSEDGKGKIQPQMVQSYSTSKDGKTWTFKLRAGLAFHDGKPVTSEDVAASLKRWSSRDAMGSVLFGFVDKLETPEASTLRMVLKEPCAIVLEALGKASSNVPFIMPARIAATPGTEQIKEHIGSGPFIFKADEFKPGAVSVYERNTKYVSRTEAPSGLAGGRPVHFDRVEWVIIRDPQTQFNAILAGEVDMVEQPSFEQYETLKKSAGVKVDDFTPAGFQYVMRFNHLHPPFNNPKIRQAAMLAVGQQAFINTQVGVPELVRPCRSIYPCSSTFADEMTGDFTGVANPTKARALLKEAGYDGTPIVMMRPTDLAAITKLPLVAKQQLEAAGFKVDLQQMDWASLVARRAKKELPAQGGWNMFFTTWSAQDIDSPLSSAMLNTRGATGWFGWQDEPRIEALKAKFARTHEGAEQKKIASQIQGLVFETAAFVPLGQYRNPTVLRHNVTGMLQTPGIPVMWGLSKP